jgi:hypothetical protein
MGVYFTGRRRSFDRNTTTGDGLSRSHARATRAVQPVNDALLAVR